MKKKNNIVFNIFALLLLIAYVVAGSMLYADRSQKNICTKLSISILDSTQAKLLTPQIIAHLLDTSNLSPLSKPLHAIALNAIQSTIAQQPYVKSVQTYTQLNGNCVIDITQRIPVLRISTDSGYDFYLDSALHVLHPPKHYAHNVKVITGNLTFSFSPTFQGQLIEKSALKDKVFLEKLINFADNISNDDFLNSLVTQIYVNAHRDIYLVPRVGEHIIIFGPPDAPTSRLLKLKKFYHQAFKSLPANTKTINLKFKNQVVIK